MAFDFNDLNSQLEGKCNEQSQKFSEDVRNIISQSMTGNIFQNPVNSLIQTSKIAIQNNDQLAGSIGSALETFGGGGEPGGPGGSNLEPAIAALENFQNTSAQATEAMNEFENFTNRLSGKVIDNEGTSYQLANAVGISTTYNNIVNNLRLPEQDLIDNFTPAFNTILPTGGGQLFASVQALNSNITNILSQYSDVSTWAGSINGINEFVNSITDSTQGLSESITSARNMVNSSKSFIDNAVAVVKRYGMVTYAMSSVLNDPCFTGELFSNVIPSPQFKEGLETIKKIGII